MDSASTYAAARQLLNRGKPPSAKMMKASRNGTDTSRGIDVLRHIDGIEGGMVAKADLEQQFGPRLITVMLSADLIENAEADTVRISDYGRRLMAE